MRSSSKSARAILAGALAIAVGAPAPCVPVRALGARPVPRHAFVRGVLPAANSNVQKPPPTAMVVMGEEGLGGPDDELHVWDSSLADHSGALSWSTVGADTRFSSPLSGMNRGWYLAGSRVVSGDGHPVSAWWAFGVGGTSPKAPTRKLSLVNPAVPAGLPGSMSVSVNGLRTGIRSVVSSAAWGAVTNVRWVLTGADPRVNGASLDWGAVRDPKKKTDTAKGIIPRAGKWTLVLTVRAKSRTGWTVSNWSAPVTITA